MGGCQYSCELYKLKLIVHNVTVECLWNYQNKALQGQLLQVCKQLEQHEQAIANFKKSEFFLLLLFRYSHSEILCIDPACLNVLFFKQTLVKVRNNRMDFFMD